MSLHSFGILGYESYTSINTALMNAVDRSGKFITEDEVQARIAQMQESRAELFVRLERDRMEAEKIAEKRRQAQKKDMLKSSDVKNLVKDA